MAERGRNTKGRILDTAQSLVLEKGFSGTSIDDILKTAGVTKGAFFHHFRSKADLARTLVERFAENDFALFDAWDRRADALADDPYQALLIFLKLFEELPLCSGQTLRMPSWPSRTSETRSSLST